MSNSLEKLQAENEMLRCEIKVTREAADITAEFVVKQFEQTERMLHRFQIADTERQAVLDAATQLSIIATDIDGKIQLFSRGAATLLGYKARDMVGKANILTLHLRDELESYGTEVSGVVESSLSGMAVFAQYVKQKRTRVREWLYTCHDGTFLPVNLSITGLFDSEGRMIGYLFTAMDLSSQNQLEFELRKAKNIAESANASKSDFLAKMSHEIRTPMNGITGMAHLLRKTTLNPAQKNYTEKLLYSSDTLLRLVNDILDFSKIDAGKLELESISFNLEDVLANVANVIGTHIEKKGLEFLFHIEPDVPDKLVGDPLRLGQVLMNLADNAVKFTPQGEIVIAVTVEERTKSVIKLRFTVRDSGIGLQTEQIDNLFTAFNQADDSVTRKYGGTGLGLAICKQLTEMMGGHIWVKSEPDHGSDFIFTTRLGLLSEEDESHGETFQIFKGLRALIVDDNKAARDILVSMLTSLKMEVTSANSGQAALAMLEEGVANGKPYDVVLLDWIMPGIDGIETARRIKANPSLSSIPAMLMVTANAREEAYREADKVGMDGFLLKPVYGSVIYNTLVQILGIETINGSLSTNKEPETVAGLDNIRGARILLVDDNTINQEVGKAFLEEVGMAVEIASSGEESLDVLKKTSFDLVLMDIQMPNMDGLEVTRKIRRNSRLKNLPIIAMTAHAMAGDREKSLAAGMNDHINKPIDPLVLYEALKQWIPEKNNAKPKVEQQRMGLDSLKEKTFPPLPGIDQREAMRRLNNQVQLFRQMLQEFQNSFSSFPSTLQELSIAGNWQKIQEMVHSIKGVASYIGATSLFRLASEVDRALVNEERERASSQLPSLIDALDEVLSSISILANEKEALPEKTKKDKKIHYDFSLISDELLHLINLLQQGELLAEEQFKLLKNMAGGLGHDTMLLEIERMIDNINYEEAAAQCKILFQKLPEKRTDP